MCVVCVCLSVCLSVCLCVNAHEHARERKSDRESVREERELASHTDSIYLMVSPPRCIATRFALTNLEKFVDVLPRPRGVEVSKTGQRVPWWGW